MLAHLTDPAPQDSTAWRSRRSAGGSPPATCGLCDRHGAHREGADPAYRGGDGEQPGAGGSRIDRRGQSRTRSYRQSFLISYAARIGERLTRATQEAAPEGGADTSRLLPVLAARERAVDEAVTEMFPSLQYRSQPVSNAQGWYAAAGLAVLDAHRPLSG